MTKRLYFEKPYLTEFTANVVSQTKTDKGWEIILDQTTFYPEGGGQAPDEGSLNNVSVKTLYKNIDKDVVHVLNEELNKNEVIGRINWDKRFGHMQQHSGQHILSAAIFNLFGLHTIQAKFDQNEGWITLERGLNEEEIQQTLMLANSIIFANKAIVTKFITLDEMSQYPLVKTPKEKFSSEGHIRIWHIEDFYTIPCGGTHVAKTGEIGIIFITKQTKENNITKVWFTTGNLTLSYLSILNKTINELTALFQTSDKDIVHVATTKLAQNKQMQNQLASQAEIVASAKSAQITGQEHGKYTVYQFSYEQDDVQILKPLLFTLTKDPNTIALALSTKLPLAISCNKDLSSGLLQTLKNTLLKHQGKGGGNLVYWQAMVPNQKQFVKDFLNSLI